MKPSSHGPELTTHERSQLIEEAFEHDFITPEALAIVQRRLRKSKKEAECHAYDFAKSFGRDWAMTFASYMDLLFDYSAVPRDWSHLVQILPQLPDKWAEFASIGPHCGLYPVAFPREVARGFCDGVMSVQRQLKLLERAKRAKKNPTHLRLVSVTPPEEK